MTETSTLLIRHFPRDLRRQLHVVMAQEDRRILEVITDLLVLGLAAKTEAAKKKEKP